MSGYLAHLVARMATGAAGAGVRPRPLSRFEPAAPEVLPPGFGSDEQAADGREASPMHRPARQPVEREPGRAAPVPPAVDAPPRRPRPAGELHPTAPPVNPVGEPAAARRPARLGYLVPHPAPDFDRWPAEPDVQPVADPLPAPGTPAERGQAPELAVSTPQPGTPGPAQTVAAVGRPPVVVASIRPIRPEPVRPQALPPGGHPRAAEAKSSSAEPAVHVTIGRVEVIATPPAHPAPLRQPDRPSGVMSLDEYLKSREEEGRP
jgi:hypothetical protein